MVAMKYLLAMFAILGAAWALPNYLNYTTTGNITGFDGAIDYSTTALSTATGYSEAFPLLILGVIFLGFYVIGSRYTQERALVYASFMTTIGAFILTSGGFLDPQWLMVCIFGLLAAAFFASRVG